MPVGTVVWGSYHLGASKIYFDWDQYGWAWFAGNFFVFIVLHDAWFYWEHRLMHQPRLFLWSHRAHHLSLAPTPWTAHSFPAAEALVQALYLPVVLLVAPAHQAVIFLRMIWMALRNVMGHSGVELLPRSWLAGWWGRWLTTTLHHEMHHAYGRRRRLAGTEHPEYRQHLQDLIRGMGEPEPGDVTVAPAQG